MTQAGVGPRQTNPATSFLINAQRLAARGENRQAYQLALEATKQNPEDINAWFWRSATAPSLEERLFSLSRLFALDPHYRPAMPHLYAAMRDLLRQEPFLAYLDETDDLYQVKSGLELYVNVPKSRAVPEPYPPPKPDTLQPVNRLLLFAGLGLLLGGVAAIVLAPLAAIRAISLLRKPISYRDQGRVLVDLVIAGGIFLAAFPISWLFIIHVFQ